MSDPDNRDFKYLRQDPVVLCRDFDVDGVSVTTSVMAETQATQRAQVRPTTAGDQVQLSIDRGDIVGAWICLSPDQARHIGRLLLQWADSMLDQSAAGDAASAAAEPSAVGRPASE